MPSHRQLFLEHMAQTSPFPLLLEVDHALGSWVYDSNGKAWLDLIAGISVSSLGHRHPAVVEAIHQQTDRYLHTMVYGEYILAPQVELASLLTSQLPASLNQVYFVNSGSEATEGAMKLAKRATGRSEIIAARRAYHGSTQGAASLMSPTDFTRPYYPLLPGISHLEFNCNWCLDRITEHTAAVIIETVQAESGVCIPEKNYLKYLRARCSETGTLLIFDEIQVGYGRTGSLFAFEQYGVIPDILLLAKGMGGGMPIGAFVAPAEIMGALSNAPILGHITTFGGHPVCCAAGLATLQTLIDTPEIINSVPEKEAMFRELLKHPKVKKIRSAGLLMAVDLDDNQRVMKVIQHCLDNGVITDWFLFNDRCLRIAPPLTISQKEIRHACTVIQEALDNC
jgi:acetylornithine/succinyldiaminopimelate/putrescine aminotransferase